MTLHSYRARRDEAAPDPDGAWLEEQVTATVTLSVPTLYVQGAEDGVSPPAAARQVPAKFDGPFACVELAGVGHFPRREAAGPWRPRSSSISSTASPNARRRRHRLSTGKIRI